MPGQTDPNDDYILSRDFLASARLSFQHDIYVARLGYLVHPSIISSVTAETTSNCSPLQILDLATGNGIWATDLAATLPAGPSHRPVHITALDISPANFPVTAIRPSNTIFGVYNFLDDVPEAYVEHFDVVHVRFAVPALFQPKASSGGDTSKRDRLIHNIHRMLKLGGWVQWQELVQPGFREVEVDGMDSTEVLKMSDEWDPAFQVMDKHISVSSQAAWVAEMGKVLESVAGFVNVQTEEPEVRRDKLRQESDLCCWNLDEALRGGLMKMVGEDAGKEMSEALQKLFNEIKDGKKVMASKVVVCVGRKKP